MVRENIIALLLLYIRPVAAIGRILDHGRLWFAIVAALGVSLFLAAAAGGIASHPHPVVVEEGAVAPQAPAGPGILVSSAESWIGYAGLFAPLLAIALVLVPIVIFSRAIAGFGSFPVLMRSDYMSLLLCGFMTWAAAYLPLAMIVATAGMSIGWAHLIFLYIAANLYFAILAALSLRTLLGISFGPAVGLVVVGCLAAVMGIALSDFAGPLRYYLMSPFLLFYGYSMFGSDLRSLGDGLRGRQHLQQQLQIATTNPRDADAHYQLGLVYQKRRQYTEAISRFQRAIEIDPSEPDAQFQLGRIAREQERYEDAIVFLKAAAALDDKLASSEVWRELGAAYVAQSRFEEAAAALAKYTQRRSYDPEGLYWYGKSLAALGRAAEAKAAFEQCVEAVDTMPKHRRAYVRKWGTLAKKEL